MHAPAHVLIACLSESGEALEEATEGAEGMDHRAAQGSKSWYQIGCARRAGQSCFMLWADQRHQQ